METLAFVEEIGRNGDVFRRHVIKQLPTRIGRGYDLDVIIDDPHVAANHLEMRLAEDGALEIVDLGSLNGTHRLGDAARISTTRIHGDDVFRIGQTQLRFRLPGQPVPTELPVQQEAWNRHPLVFLVSVGLLIFISAWSSFSNTFNTDTSDMVVLPITVFGILLIWVSVWSLVCRTLHGGWNFVAHGIVAFFGVCVIELAETLTGYIKFSFDLHLNSLIWSFCLAAVIASVLDQHLRLTIRLSPRILVILAAFVVAILYGGSLGLQAVQDADKPGLQSFDTTIKPSVFLLVQGISPDQFVEMAAQLKVKADKGAVSMIY